MEESIKRIGEEGDHRLRGEKKGSEDINARPRFRLLDENPRGGIAKDPQKAAGCRPW